MRIINYYNILRVHYNTDNIMSLCPLFMNWKTICHGWNISRKLRCIEGRKNEITWHLQQTNFQYGNIRLGFYSALWDVLNLTGIYYWKLFSGQGYEKIIIVFQTTDVIITIQKCGIIMICKNYFHINVCGGVDQLPSAAVFGIKKM